MIAIWCILFTVWAVGFLAYAYFEMVSYRFSAKAIVAALAWPILVLAFYLDEWAYGGDDDI